MAVPDTGAFSLQDVVDEINPTTDDLVDCVSDASSGSYDGTYYTSPATSLLEFRNYGAAAAQLTLIASGNNFQVASATAFQSIQLEFEYVSQSTTGGAAIVTHNGTTKSVGDTVVVNTVGGPGTIWDINSFTNPFSVADPLSGVATVTIGIKINSTSVDTFPTGQVTNTKDFS
jgi:hypothetical protein